MPSTGFLPAGGSVTRRSRLFFVFKLSLSFSNFIGPFASTRLQSFLVSRFFDRLANFFRASSSLVLFPQFFSLFSYLSFSTYVLSPCSNHLIFLTIEIRSVGRSHAEGRAGSLGTPTRYHPPQSPECECNINVFRADHRAGPNA